MYYNPVQAKAALEDRLEEQEQDWQMLSEQMRDAGWPLEAGEPLILRVH